LAVHGERDVGDMVATHANLAMALIAAGFGRDE